MIFKLKIALSNHNGHISYKEFLKLLRRIQNASIATKFHY